MTTDSGKGGYGRPPQSGRFKSGKSGNPAGRPKGRHKELPYESVLGQIVTVSENETSREVTAEDAFLLRLAELAIKGNNAAARSMENFGELRTQQRGSSVVNIPGFNISFVRPGSVTTAVVTLKIGRILDRFREESASVALEPWIVEAALARFGDKRLTAEEQAKVLAATRTPKKVAWPDWWEALPE